MPSSRSLLSLSPTHFCERSMFAQTKTWTLRRLGRPPLMILTLRYDTTITRLVFAFSQLTSSDSVAISLYHFAFFTDFGCIYVLGLGSISLWL